MAYIQYFLIGFLLTDIFLGEWQQAPKHSAYWDAIALMGWPALILVLHSAKLAHWLFPFIILLVYCATFRGVVFNRFFVNPWITATGGMCYSIYLIHYEVISAVARFTKAWTANSPYWLHLLFQSVVVGGAVLAASAVFFLAIEKPCMQRDWPQKLWNYLHGRQLPT